MYFSKPTENLLIKSVARWAHNPKVAVSNPAPNTNIKPSKKNWCSWRGYFYPYSHYRKLFFPQYRKGE